MSWKAEFLPEASRDMEGLDGSVKKQIFKGIQKVSENPLPANEGGYGKPLGNNDGTRLANLLKVKFKKFGIRIVYKIIRKDNEMLILIISAGTDDNVYKEAVKRRKKYGV